MHKNVTFVPKVYGEQFRSKLIDVMEFIQNEIKNNDIVSDIVNNVQYRFGFSLQDCSNLVSYILYFHKNKDDMSDEEKNVLFKKITSAIWNLYNLESENSSPIDKYVVTVENKDKTGYISYLCETKETAEHIASYSNNPIISQIFIEVKEP